MTKSITGLFLCLVVLLFAVPAFAANPCGLSAAKIMKAIKSPPAGQSDDLTIVVAHRGLHGTIANSKYYYTPENSMESLDNADAECLEAVELDVRMNSNSQPVVSHDYNWGRQATTPDSSGKCCFNPYDFSGNNPSVAGTSYNTAQSYVLRPTTDLYKKSIWNEHPPTLAQMLDHYQSKGFAFVIFLDIKDTAFMPAWQVVASKHMQDRVIFKVPANLYPTPDYIVSKFGNFHYACGCATPDTAYINVMPYYSTSDIAPNNGFGPGTGESKLVTSAHRWQEWNYYFTGTPFFAGMEINIKESGGILAQVAIAMRGESMTKGIFNPVGEYRKNNSSEWFYNSDGTCCSQMSSYYFNGAPYGLPSDKSDGRLHSDFIKAHVTPNYINLITTDNPLQVATVLQSWGKRNTLRWFR